MRERVKEDEIKRAVGMEEGGRKQKWKIGKKCKIKKRRKGIRKGRL